MYLYLFVCLLFCCYVFRLCFDFLLVCICLLVVWNAEHSQSIFCTHSGDKLFLPTRNPSVSIDVLAITYFLSAFIFWWRFGDKQSNRMRSNARCFLLSTQTWSGRGVGSWPSLACLSRCEGRRAIPPKLLTNPPKITALGQRCLQDRGVILPQRVPFPSAKHWVEGGGGGGQSRQGQSSIESTVIVCIPCKLVVCAVGSLGV